MWVFPVGLGACVLWGQRSDSCNIYTRLAAKVRKEPGKKNEAHMRVSEKKNNKATFCVSSWVRQIKRVFTCMYVSMSACVCVCVCLCGKVPEKREKWEETAEINPDTMQWTLNPTQMFDLAKCLPMSKPNETKTTKYYSLWKCPKTTKKKTHTACEPTISPVAYKGEIPPKTFYINENPAKSRKLIDEISGWQQMKCKKHNSATKNSNTKQFSIKMV